jgi:hypothetical protein
MLFVFGQQIPEAIKNDDLVGVYIFIGFDVIRVVPFFVFEGNSTLFGDCIFKIFYEPQFIRDVLYIDTGVKG